MRLPGGHPLVPHQRVIPDNAGADQTVQRGFFHRTHLLAALGVKPVHTLSSVRLGTRISVSTSQKKSPSPRTLQLVRREALLWGQTHEAYGAAVTWPPRFFS